MGPYKYADDEVEELSALDEFELADIEYEYWKLNQEEKDRVRRFA